jgi:hypothetical protein
VGEIRILARATLRAGWRGAIVVALLVGVAGGAVLTAWAGARRIAGAYDRALVETKSQDVLASAVYDFQNQQLPDISKLARLPQLETSGRLAGIGVVPLGRTGEPAMGAQLGSVAPTSPEPYHSITRPQLLEGRFPVAVDEIALSRESLRAINDLGIRVALGDRFHAAYYSFQDLGTEPEHAFHPVELRIVGIAQDPDVRVSSDPTGRREAMLSEAFGRAHADNASFNLVVGRLAPGYDAASFVRAARATYPGTELSFQTSAQGRDQYGALARPYVQALRLFALVAGLASLLVVGQALVRQARADARATPTLRALGMRHVGLAGAALARSALSVALGLFLAVVGAAVASRWLTIGPARLVTVGSHFAVDRTATGIFVLAGGLALGAVVVVSALVATRRIEGMSIAARRARALSELRFPPSPWTGIRRALADVGRDRPSAAATIGGVLVAAATVAAALTFAGGLDRFVTQPARWGWHWDAIYDTNDNTFDPAAATAMLQVPEVRGLTIGTRGTITSNGANASGYGIDSRRGDVGPEVQHGRLPASASEIALAPRTLAAFDTHVGGRIPLAAPNGKNIEYRVVGTVAVPPSLDQSGLDRLGAGAVLTSDGLARVDPQAVPSFVLLDFAPGFDGFDRLNRAWQDFGGRLARTEVPVEITSYSHVRGTPLVLAGLLALLGLGVLAHALAVSARSDTPQFAVLRSLGFLRRQIRASMSWQATALLALGGGVGVLLGIAAGRFLWHRFVSDLGFTAGAAIPLGALLAACLGVAVFANAVAFWCGQRTMREAAGAQLRTE